MEHIQKDDIIIRKGILHILDSHTGYLGLSSQLLEMGPDLMEFVRGHIFKIMDRDTGSFLFIFESVLLLIPVCLHSSPFFIPLSIRVFQRLL